IMDMRKFSGERFIKLVDVAEGPIPERIADVREGKYGKPDLIFASGDILSLNATNNDILRRAFGDDSDAWLDKDVELYQGEIKYQGNMQDAVMVKPISPTQKRADATTEERFGDPDDQIPF